MSADAPLYLPVIDKNDFAAFRDLMDRDFKNSYRSWQDWQKLHAGWAEIHGDSQPTPVMIRSSDFAVAERRRADPPDMRELLDYTERMADAAA